MAKMQPGTEVQVGPQGRIVIPAALRRALDLKAGDRLVMRRDGDTLVLERREAVARRLRERFRHVPPDVSLVDELLDQRRGEAVREAARG